MIFKTRIRTDSYMCDIPCEQWTHIIVDTVSASIFIISKGFSVD